MKGDKKTMVKEKEEAITIDGVIKKIERGDNFVVEIANENKSLVICKPSGRMRQNHIRLVIEDRVVVEVSPYDLSKGRITYRK
jgi:translation initiation factor IF-1